MGIDFSIGAWDIEASYSDIETVFDTYLPIPFLIGEVSNVFYDVADAEQPTLNFDGDLQDISYFLPLQLDAIGNRDRGRSVQYQCDPF